MGQRVRAQRTVVDRDGQRDGHHERLDLHDLGRDTVLGEDDLVPLEIAHRPAVRSNTAMMNENGLVLREEQTAGRKERRHASSRDDGAQTRGDARHAHGGGVAWALRYSKTPARS